MSARRTDPAPMTAHPTETPAPLSEEQEHGVREALYASNGVWYVPRFFCLCGWTGGKGHETWEDAGAEFDEHLARAALNGGTR